MGKAALLMVVASTMIMVSVSTTRFKTELETEKAQVQYEQKVLAREAAASFFNILQGKTLVDFDGFRIQNSSLKYRDATLSFSAIGSTGDEVALAAVAYVGDASHSITGTVIRTGSGLLDAVTIDGEIGEIKAAGNKFNITGLDTNPGGIIGWAVGAATYGIRTTSAATATALRAAIDGSQITGLNDKEGLGTHSMVTGPSPVDLDKLYDDILAYASSGVTGAEVIDGDQAFVGNEIIGSAEEPVVIVVNGNLDMGGTIIGYGVLMINGHLSIAHGTPRWEGLIYATGVRADGGGGSSEFKGTFDIYGALILRTVSDDIDTKDIDESSTLDFSINGDVNLMYSSAALARLSALLPALKIEPTTIVLGDIREIASQKTRFGGYSNYTTAGGG